METIACGQCGKAVAVMSVPTKADIKASLKGQPDAGFAAGMFAQLPANITGMLKMFLAFRCFSCARLEGYNGSEESSEENKEQIRITFEKEAGRE